MADGNGFVCAGIGSLTDGYGIVAAGSGIHTDGNCRFFFCQCGFTDGDGVAEAAFCSLTDGDGGGDVQFLGIRTHTRFFTDSDVVRTDHICTGTPAEGNIVHTGGVVARTFTDGDLAFVAIGVTAAVCPDINGIRTDCSSCGDSIVIYARVCTHHNIARTCRYGFVTDGDGIVGGGFAVLAKGRGGFSRSDAFFTDGNAAHGSCLGSHAQSSCTFGSSIGLITYGECILIGCHTFQTDSNRTDFSCRTGRTDSNSILSANPTQSLCLMADSDGIMTLRNSRRHILSRTDGNR